MFDPLETFCSVYVVLEDAKLQVKPCYFYAHHSDFVEDLIKVYGRENIFKLKINQIEEKERQEEKSETWIICGLEVSALDNSSVTINLDDKLKDTRYEISTAFHCSEHNYATLAKDFTITYKE